MHYAAWLIALTKICIRKEVQRMKYTVVKNDDGNYEVVSNDGIVVAIVDENGIEVK